MPYLGHERNSWSNSSFGNSCREVPDARCAGDSAQFAEAEIPSRPATSATGERAAGPFSIAHHANWGVADRAAMRLMLLGIVSLASVMVAPAHADAVKTRISYMAMADRLTDLRRLAILPDPDEKALLFSSYDRSSSYEAPSDRYVNWDANGDGGGVIRREGQLAILAEVTGPGSIVRMWSATPANGKVSIYLDDMPEPVISAPFEKYYDGSLTGHKLNNLVYDRVSPEVAGSNNFVPILFSKSCKIVAEKDWGKYYQFNVVKFPKSAFVESTTIPLGDDAFAALVKADAKLAGPARAGDASGEQKSHRSFELTPGRSVVAFDLKGAQLITSFRVYLALSGDVDSQRVLLRKLAVRITWDGEKRPAVWSPLGDFFGYFGGSDAYSTIVMGVGSNGDFYSNWVMPFSQRAKIEFINDSEQTVTLSSDVTLSKPDQDMDSYARFHAKWHRDSFLPERRDRQIDWTLLKVMGRGRFVGTHLHVWNPVKGWWGEGDEKFFVDGEKFPSIFGTGTEDFFGFAWGSAGQFSRPFHNQILNEGNAGHAVLNRWLLADNVPFQFAFEGYLEKYFGNSRPTSYSAVAYWYQNAGGEDPYQEVPLAERIYWK